MDDLWFAIFGAILLAMTLAVRLGERVWPALRRTWPSALMLLAGFAILMGSDQGQEVAFGLRDEHWHAAFVVAAALWWAAQAWFWSRFALSRRYGIGRNGWGGAAWAVKWLPRIYGAGSLATAAAAVGFALAGAGPSLDLLGIGAALVAALVAFLAVCFLEIRMRLTARTDELLQRKLPESWSPWLRRCVVSKENGAEARGPSDATSGGLTCLQR